MTLRTGNKIRLLGLRVGGSKDLRSVDTRPKSLKPHTLNPLSSQLGLTLIEVLLAVSIMAIGTIGVLRAYAGSLEALEVGQNNIDSLNLIKEKLSDVRLEILEAQGELPDRASGQVNEFLWEWSISSTSIEEMSELNLIVSHEYNPRTLAIKTYVAQKAQEEQEE